jgi:hypothetical protein
LSKDGKRKDRPREQWWLEESVGEQKIKETREIKEAETRAHVGDSKKLVSLMTIDQWCWGYCG